MQKVVFPSIPFMSAHIGVSLSNNFQEQETAFAYLLSFYQVLVISNN